MPLNVEQVIELLDLKPLPQEGGLYRETYRAELKIADTALPDDYDGERNVSTAIYYLVMPDVHSGLHRLPTDEVFHFYLGDAVEMLQLHPDGTSEMLTLGTDLAAGMRPQVVVPGNTWQAARLIAGGQFALLGTTVAPGFDFRDFHSATSEEVKHLAASYPKWADLVRQLAPRQQ